MTAPVQTCRPAIPWSRPLHLLMATRPSGGSNDELDCFHADESRRLACPQGIASAMAATVVDNGRRMKTCPEVMLHPLPCTRLVTGLVRLSACNCLHAGEEEVSLCSAPFTMPVFISPSHGSRDFQEYFQAPAASKSPGAARGTCNSNLQVSLCMSLAAGRT